MIKIVVIIINIRKYKGLRVILKLRLKFGK